MVWGGAPIFPRGALHIEATKQGVWVLMVGWIGDSLKIPPPETRATSPAWPVAVAQDWGPWLVGVRGARHFAARGLVFQETEALQWLGSV